MILLETVAVAFAMFSAIPCPQPVWNEKNMRYALCAFPLIGVVCGLLWWGWSALIGYVGGPVILQAGSGSPAIFIGKSYHLPENYASWFLYPISTSL